MRGEVGRLVVENDQLPSVDLTDGQIRLRTAVFVVPIHTPQRDGLLATLGCDVDEVGPSSSTVPGTRLHRACGRPATPPPRAQVTNSAVAGSAAAIAINADLVQDDIATAVRAARRGDVGQGEAGTGLAAASAPSLSSLREDHTSEPDRS